MAVGFNLPDPYEAQKAEIARRRKYAETLQQQALQPTEPFSYQGIQAPIPATATLAKVLQGLAGGYMQAESSREERELREGDIKKGQEFAAALQGAKTPEERQALATNALGGNLGLRAQAMAGPVFTMAETAQQKELALRAAAEKAREDREQRARDAEANRENRLLMANMMAGLRAQGMSDTRAFQEATLALREQGQQQQAELAREKMAQPTTTEQGQYFKLKEQTDSAESAIEALKHARELSNKFEGGKAGTLASAAERQVLPLIGVSPSESAKATALYDNIMQSQAVEKLKATFPGAISNAEREFLVKLQASSGETQETRNQIIDEAIKKAEKNAKDLKARSDAIMTRSYRQLGSAPTPPAPTPPGGALTADEQRELDALRARFPRATR